MEKSESIKEIAKALNLFQAEVELVKKDGINPFFKSKYATLENVICAAKPLLDKNALAFAQFPDGDGLYTIIMHESGEWIGATASLELKNHTPQDQGSAITYMRRYALSAALGLATEEDDDGNAATQAVKAKPVPPAKVANEREAQDKAQIVELCHAKSEVPLLDKNEIKAFILKQTGLVYGEAKNAEIIERLKAI